MKNKYLLLIILIIFPILLFSQNKISGKIINSETKETIVGANILLKSGLGAVSDKHGNYLFQSIPAGTYSLKVSCVGFNELNKNIEINSQENKIINLELIPSNIETNEVVVTATKTENRIYNVPVRINTVSSRQLQSLPIQSVDEALQYISGVNISRPFGIFATKSTVSMRGVSGKEQARTLVLLDGAPLNKSDGGTVDWNMINTDVIQRIEVTKGAGAALYGGNAMGGVINIITRKPAEKLAGKFALEYGTYNTQAARMNLSGKMLPDSSSKNYYWNLTSFYRKSDGYITQSEEDRQMNQYITKSNVKEYGVGGVFGYQINKNNNLQFDATFYDDKRGTGETVFQPLGNVTEHKTYQLRAKYSGTYKGLNFNSILFYSNENYLRVNEYLKDDYTWYNVDSKRIDFGLLSTFSKKITDNQAITGGIDVKQGKVDAKDEYFTSTDIVYNRGKMDFYALFVQDEIKLYDEKFKIIAGLRADYAKYYDGAFYITDPTAETQFMRNIEDPNMKTQQWVAVSPKLALQYKWGESQRTYLSYSKGFRPSVLDDLCRSGRVKGGFKLTNQELKPEYIDNFEWGFDLSFWDKIRFGFSTYYSVGKDFMYYVSTGATIDMGFGDRPIMARSNVSNVEIYGVEIDFNYEINSTLYLFANYAFTYSQIKNYTKLTPNDTIDLNGKYLTDVPKNTFSAGINWRNRFVNTSLLMHYTDKMWVNDANVYDDIIKSAQYPDYYTIDLKLSKTIFKYFEIALNIQNILDQKFYDSKAAVCPGRFTMGEFVVKF